MRVSFFEEYPSADNLAKLKLVKFPARLYIAAHSIEEFSAVKKKIKAKNVKAVVYWPILSIDEGYWLSPFSSPVALLRVMHETNGKEVLWDAELPRKRRHLVTRLPFFWGNRALIREFIRQNKEKVYTAEYFTNKSIVKRLLVSMGLSFAPSEYGNKMVKMVYSSMHNYLAHFVRKEFQEGVRLFGDRFIVALGVLAAGVEGNEKRIKLEILERDLRIAKELGVSEVIIYRLGGLDEKYAALIGKFAK